MSDASQPMGALGAPRRALVVGAGLIGGSIAAALHETGQWTVEVTDLSAQAAADAVASGVADAAVPWPPPSTSLPWDVAVVATPAGAVIDTVEVLGAYDVGVITDVASVKSAIAAGISLPNFVPGHPMAGSEMVGIAGAHPLLFAGASWVLTPTASTSPAALAEVMRLVAALGAEPMIVDAAEHDEMVATVSHVPHLTAVTLMSLASQRSASHALLLRLAAGGFRDMTRVAAGHPSIWPDICAANRTAIVTALDDLIAELTVTRDVVDGGDREGLLSRLQTAQEARLDLPVGRKGLPERLAELRVRIGDFTGQLATVTAEAARHGINIYDMEIDHSVEGAWGLAILLVEEAKAPELHGYLRALGMICTYEALDA